MSMIMNMTDEIMKANFNMYKSAVILNISDQLPKGFTLDSDTSFHRLHSKDSWLYDEKLS